MLDRRPARERLGQKSPQRLTRYFVLVMAIVYTALGFYLLLVPVSIFSLPATPRRLLGAVFVLYGIIRFVRNYRSITGKNDEE
ncbi:hypothetical protein LRS06_08035 [Hymenobacter sp. J193]|uniref:hypothetical protein n=1 Tax=Hymenobacter sp. J193 TaxID=2898429 RepID=UPI002151D769|nr:hypothetical protein [Hymenobacter sp. J193]MCR5887728.1 hypothetical protein [Hymenobacter sp. J193]